MSERKTVRALVDTTDGTRMVADIPVVREVQLGCGCTRYDGIRPGQGDPDTYRGVSVHTGCSQHEDERWHGSIPAPNGPRSLPSERDLEEMDPHRCAADWEEVGGL